MPNILLDTGAFVALLDKSERNHQRVANFFRNFRGELLTTEPVLTEAVYLLGPSSRVQKICIDFILNGAATLISQSMESLKRATVLMEKYHDIPMDFADATLVVLAGETGICDVFTLDKRGFNSYRIHGKKAFTILPE